MSDTFEDMFKDPPDDEHAEALLKVIEKKAREDAKKSFSEALSDRVWRTADGRYVDMNKMSDNHLLNAYNLVAKNLTSFLSRFTDYDTIKKTLDDIANGKFDMVDKTAIMAQAKGYHYLSEEIKHRGLFQKLLEQSANEAFDVFNDIINSKPDDLDEA